MTFKMEKSKYPEERRRIASGQAHARYENRRTKITAKRETIETQSKLFNYNMIFLLI
jgi:hypothetical protein